ncbi:MAG: response regulator transcription factor [Chitinophagales bacterium]|nr:response regulator transcription factor [Chitinophagales bacterium]MCZ2394634.1 response regulator transcription factor [Chitinophagales bacterium]
MAIAARNKQVLLVEDDPNLGILLQEYLSHKQFDVTLKRNGEEGLLAYRRGSYDILLLDVMMPKMDGFTLAEEIRKDNQDIPIIFLTAKSLKEDKIKGLTIGADDYITKPFSMEVLELKMNVILRRVEKAEVQVALDEYHAGHTLLDYKNQKIVFNHQSIKLTTKENELLRLFFERKNNILEREVALKHVWQDDSYFTARSMDVFISKLRKYLKDDATLSIVNVHGTGYKLLENL